MFAKAKEITDDGIKLVMPPLLDFIMARSFNAISEFILHVCRLQDQYSFYIQKTYLWLIAFKLLHILLRNPHPS